MLRPAEPAGVALYRAFGGMLQSFLTRKFGAGPRDIHHLLRREDPAGRNEGVADRAACRNAKTYLQRRGLAVTDSPDDAREMENLLFCQNALASLPEPAREALRLRFLERRTYEESPRSWMCLLTTPSCW